jgi:phosphonate transport system substrate-binding protein
MSPEETFYLYVDLFNYISKKIGRPIKFKQKQTYMEVNKMLKNNEIDIAFICSGAYISNTNDFKLFAVPLYHNRPYYQAYIIANIHSGINSLVDFYGKSFAFSDRLSLTGKLYPIKRVKELGFVPKTFFSKIIYSGAHDISIKLVEKKLLMELLLIV